MVNIDRHLTIQAGWVAGPAFGVAMMAAPEYFHFRPVASGFLFWGGILVFLATVAVVFVISVHEEHRRKAVLGPIITMAIGALIFCGGCAWYFWPGASKQTVLSDLNAEFEGMYVKLSNLLSTENRPAVHIKNDKNDLDTNTRNKIPSSIRLS